MRRLGGRAKGVAAAGVLLAGVLLGGCDRAEQATAKSPPPGVAVTVADDRPKLFEHWDRLAAARPFWR